MKISVILAHPNKESFNHAIASITIEALNQNEHEVCFHDLYDEQFDPILPFEEISKDILLPPIIEKHCREIAEADGIIIIHPNWWGQPPAILKGWVDRIIRPGVAYELLESDTGEGVPIGLLKAKAAMVFNTSNTDAKRERDIFGDPLESLWKNCVFDLCGVSNFYRRMFTIIVTSSEEQREEWLMEVKRTVQKYYPKMKGMKCIATESTRADNPVALHCPPVMRNATFHRTALMDENIFPEIIANLPKAGIQIEGLSSYLFQGKDQQIVFMEFEHDIEVPEHSHTAQWGAVLSGEIELTIDGRKYIVEKGGTYFIPAGAKHAAKIKAGYKDVTLFNQKDRYQEK